MIGMVISSSNSPMLRPVSNLKMNINTLLTGKKLSQNLSALARWSYQEISWYTVKIELKGMMVYRYGMMVDWHNGQR